MFQPGFSGYFEKFPPGCWTPQLKLGPANLPY